MRNIKLLLLAALLAASPAVQAVDGLAVEGGHSDSSNVNVNLYRISAQWDWKKKLIEFGSWHLGGYWETTFGYWDNNSNGAWNGQIYDIGFTPVFRLQPNNLKGFSGYVEAAVGLHVLSHASINNERQFGSAFQFGDHVGLGMRFGQNGQFDLGYRYQHLSNGGIKDPNQGINFHQIRLQYHFQ